MTALRISAGAMAGMLALGAVPAAGQYRDGQPAMAAGAPAMRAGQPDTLPAPPAPLDPGAIAAGRFAAAYTRARSPRLVVFWNRELTDDLETEREDVTSFSASSRSDAQAHRRDFATRRADHSVLTARSGTDVEGEVRSGVRRIVTGRRASPHGEATDFDMQRGFTDALAEAGARLVDRTTLMRTAALSGDTANAQAVEARALLAGADMVLEVVPMGDGGAGDATPYRIVARDLRSGRVVATIGATARPPGGRMPLVAGPHGFVRATPPRPGAVEMGRALAIRAMEALAARL